MPSSSSCESSSPKLYGLPHHPCAQEQGGCHCSDKALEQVLDEAEAAA